MKNIEEILENLIKEYPEMLEQKHAIRKILLSMEKNNPDIHIDTDFKQALKNKLEVQAYAKIRNTENKKINIAKKGKLSFKKDAKSIFEKPKLNFFKILSPLFIGTFALLGFFHFFGDNLFIIKTGGELEYINPKVQEKKANLQLEKNRIKEEAVQEAQVQNLEQGTQKGITEQSTENIKQTISEKIKTRNQQKQIERDDVIKEPQQIDTKVVNKEVDTFVGMPDSTEEKSSIEAEFKVKAESNTPVQNSIVNTEVTDILGNDANSESLEQEFSDDSIMGDFQGAGISNMMLDEEITEEDSIDSSPQLTEFERFCEEKQGVIEDRVCKYGELVCGEEDFTKNSCE